MHPFQYAVEARDAAAVERSLADDVVVMVGPLSAANALQVAMGADMERIQHEATMTVESDRKEA
ncbi:hypothetical protein H7J06_08505 [Mycobacterium hodleri]|nr:hypothetical protein [Mycolicibacterium hodleri]